MKAILKKNHQRLKEISEELIEVARIDQEMRNKIFQAEAEGKDLMFYFDQSLDQKNAVHLKEIINVIGWPTISLVGEKASEDAWLIAQHSDHDLEFQKFCLELMISAKSDDVKKRNLAYLSDRVAVHENRPQLYGTQFVNDPETGGVKMGNIEDLENLNKRRAEMNLEPFEEYLANFNNSPRGKILKK